MRKTLDEPWVVSAQQDEVETFVNKRVARGDSYEDIRDNIVFNFNDSDDVLLFLKSMRILNLRVNVTLFGMEYLSSVLEYNDDV
jgi:hypothetical protein